MLADVVWQCLQFGIESLNKYRVSKFHNLIKCFSEVEKGADDKESDTLLDEIMAA